MLRLAGAVLLACALLASSAGAQVAVENPVIAWDSGAGNWDAAKAVTVSGDFDGDGKTDIAAFYDNGNNNLRVWVFRGTGSPGGVSVAAPAIGFDSTPGGWNSAQAKYIAGDFDADGKDDLAAYYDYGGAQTKLWVWRSTGGTSFAPGVVAWDSLPGNWEWGRTKPVTGDFDGDGRDELGAFYSYDGNFTRLFVFRFSGPPGSGSTVTTSAPWESSPGGWDGNRSTPLAADVDGDGKTDVTMFYDYGGALTKLWVLRATGAAPTVAFDTGAVAWDSGGGRWDAGRMKPFRGDFNADGKGDLGAFYDLGGGTSDMQILRSTGAGSVVGPGAVWNSGPGNWTWDRTQQVSGDFDGDGRTDVGAFYRYDGAHTRLWLFRTRESDRDGDGLVDSGDQCPDQHRGQFDADANGCPDDGDRDGVLAGTDCNDANPAIRPGAVDVPVDGIDQDCSGADARHPRLAAITSVKAVAFARYTRIDKLRVSDLTGDETVEVRCKGRGCPFKRRTRTARRAGTLKLDSLLRGRRLRPGVLVEIRITRPGYEGRVLTVRARRNRRPPATSRRCLPVGGGRSFRC